MQKKTYTRPTIQAYEINPETNLLSTSSLTGNPPKWDEGHNDWFSSSKSRGISVENNEKWPN